MLYIHSNSLIEQCIFHHLNAKIPSAQVDFQEIETVEDIENFHYVKQSETLVYSFLQFDYYRFLNTFVTESDKVDIIIEFAKKNKIEKIIVITYPGAFPGSDNLFLHFKGEIEKKFYESKIECVFFHTQAIVDSNQKVNNLHALFFQSLDSNYTIPQKSNIQIYSITLHNIVQLILGTKRHEGHFDAFDEVMDLKVFLMKYGRNIPVYRIPPTYLYFKSFIGKYISPTMMSLFLRTPLAMYSSRTEKEFGISLASMSLRETEFMPTNDYKISPVFGTKGFKLST